MTRLEPSSRDSRQHGRRRRRGVGPTLRARRWVGGERWMHRSELHGWVQHPGCPALPGAYQRTRRCDRNGLASRGHSNPRVGTPSSDIRAVPRTPFSSGIGSPTITARGSHGDPLPTRSANGMFTEDASCGRLAPVAVNSRSPTSARNACMLHRQVRLPPANCREVRGTVRYYVQPHAEVMLPSGCGVCASGSGGDPRTARCDASAPRERRRRDPPKGRRCVPHLKATP